MLPALVAPDIKFACYEDRIWTALRPINLLPNGLVDDTSYYKELSEKRGYTVSIYENVSCEIKELLISDYLTLNETNWLSDFLIDIAFNVLNTTKKYEIIGSNYATVIFSHTTYTPFFVRKIKLNSHTSIALPILIGGNHWCLAIADFENKIFKFLDPFGSTHYNTNQKLNIFIRFLEQYNKIHAENLVTTGWRTKVETHIIQKDAYNCGAYIIYFFQRLVKGLPLSTPCDIDDYRKVLKKELIQTSICMRQKCFLCARNVDMFDSVLCIHCSRRTHKKCLTSQSDYTITADICTMCKRY